MAARKCGHLLRALFPVRQVPKAVGLREFRSSDPFRKSQKVTDRVCLRASSRSVKLDQWLGLVIPGELAGGVPDRQWLLLRLGNRSGISEFRDVVSDLQNYWVRRQRGASERKVNNVTRAICTESVFSFPPMPR